MAPDSTIHLVRHAQGYHQLPLSHPDISLHDPELTPYGREQCQRFCAQFTHHKDINLLCASPMRRTLLTTLLAFEPEVSRGMRVVTLPDAQETTDAPSDIGSPPSTLMKEFGDQIDYSNLSDDWYLKTAHNAVDHASLFARARRLRRWLRERKEKEIVLVTRGAFAHFISGNVDEKGQQIGKQTFVSPFAKWHEHKSDGIITGEYWNNIMERSFSFRHKDDDKAVFVETVESERKTITNEHIKHDEEVQM